MDAFVTAIMPATVQLLEAIVICVMGYLGVKIKNFYQAKVDTQQKADIVWHTVQYVEQVFTDLKGKEKFNECLNQVDAVLKEKGIPFGKEELTILIESAVKSMNESIKG